MTSFSATDVAYLAVIVSAFAALVAFVGSIAVAIVNAVAARLQVRAVAHREYLLKTLQPVLDYTESVAKGHELVYFAIRKSEPDLQKAIAEANVTFNQLSGIGLVMRTPSLAQEWKAIKAAEQELHRLIGEIDRERAHRGSLAAVEEKYEEALKPLRSAVMGFREAVEKLVF